MKLTVVAGAVVVTLTAGCAAIAPRPASLPHVAAPEVSGARSAAPSVTSVAPGRLAFVSAGQLYVLQHGAGGTHVRRIVLPAARHAIAPAWAPDGRWLAYLVTRRSSYFAGSTGTLWLVRADGTGARQVLHRVDGFSWSPSTDVLAVDQTARGARLAGPAWLVRPGHDPRRIAGLEDGLSWSPDGARLAFSAAVRPRQGGFYGLLGTMDATGGHRVVHYRSRENLMILHGWTQDGRSLLAWADAQGSASLAADGLPLRAVSLVNGHAHRVATTLVDPGFVSTSPKTSDIAVAAGVDRELADHKLVELCTVGGTCSRLPGHRPGATTLDPALSPAGYQLAFVHAGAHPPQTSAPPYAQRSIQAWYRTRTLWLDSYTGGNPHRLRAAGTGVAAPQWSHDGRSILFVRDNALWLIHANSHRPARRIAGPLFAGHWPNYYGYVSWSDQFAWTG